MRGAKAKTTCRPKADQREAGAEDRGGHTRSTPKPIERSCGKQSARLVADGGGRLQPHSSSQGERIPPLEPGSQARGAELPNTDPVPDPEDLVDYFQAAHDALEEPERIVSSRGVARWIQRPVPPPTLAGYAAKAGGGRETLWEWKIRRERGRVPAPERRIM